MFHGCFVVLVVMNWRGASWFSRWCLSFVIKGFPLTYIGLMSLPVSCVRGSGLLLRRLRAGWFLFWSLLGSGCWMCFSWPALLLVGLLGTGCCFVIWGNVSFVLHLFWLGYLLSSLFICFAHCVNVVRGKFAFLSTVKGSLRSLLCLCTGVIPSLKLACYAKRNLTLVWCKTSGGIQTRLSNKFTFKRKKKKTSCELPLRKTKL